MYEKCRTTNAQEDRDYQLTSGVALYTKRGCKSGSVRSILLTQMTIFAH